MVVINGREVHCGREEKGKNICIGGNKKAVMIFLAGTNGRERELFFEGIFFWQYNKP